MRNFIKKYSQRVAVAAILWLALAVLVSVFLSHSADKERQRIAMRTVQCLYDFGNLEQLEAQQLELSTLVDEYVYNQLVYDNEERRLNTYLKFAGSTSAVNFIEVTDDHVIYSIDCAALMDGRKFLFQYHLNSFGKIDKVYEAELIDFIVGGD